MGFTRCWHDDIISHRSPRTYLFWTLLVLGATRNSTEEAYFSDLFLFHNPAISRKKFYHYHCEAFYCKFVYLLSFIFIIHAIYRPTLYLNKKIKNQKETISCISTWIVPASSLVPVQVPCWASAPSSPRPWNCLQNAPATDLFYNVLWETSFPFLYWDPVWPSKCMRSFQSLFQARRSTKRLTLCWLPTSHSHSLALYNSIHSTAIVLCL